jgi:thiol-disulfide isomerase/thioredoxin
VEIQVVKYEQLTDAVKAHRGKVVVVDAWGTFCAPCKEEFPHLVEMHKKYGADGLVCISVCIPFSDKNPLKDKPAALTFLTEQRAVFQNFLLENGWKVCNDKWDVSGVPVTFVFDREGRRVRKFNNDDPKSSYTMKDVEMLVQELLKSKK